MLQTPTEFLCRITETGFELYGIPQETPYLKQNSLNKGISLAELVGNDIILCRGFREEMLKDSILRPFFYDRLKIPGEYRPFFSIISPQLNELDYRLQNFHSKTPFDELLSCIKSDNSDEPSFDLQYTYISTGIKLIEKISKENIKDPFDLLIDAWCVLGEFYHLEGLLLASSLGEKFYKILPPSSLCPVCLEPMKDPKDNRFSEICKKCRHDVKIEKQRSRRGTPIIGERYCSCGCGEIITGSANKKYVNDTHGRRKQRR